MRNHSGDGNLHCRNFSVKEGSLSFLYASTSDLDPYWDKTPAHGEEAKISVILMCMITHPEVVDSQYVRNANGRPHLRYFAPYFYLPRAMEKFIG